MVVVVLEVLGLIPAISKLFKCKPTNLNLFGLRKLGNNYDKKNLTLAVLPGAFNGSNKHSLGQKMNSRVIFISLGLRAWVFKLGLVGSVPALYLVLLTEAIEASQKHVL